MGHRHGLRWVGWWLFAALAVSGCSSDTPDPGTTTCFPECRAGTVCSPAGACVSACNPTCGAGETCQGSGASARCVPGTDGGSTTDLGPTESDVLETDRPPAVDTGGDAGTPGADGSALLPGCGMSGQPCCSGRGCYGAGYCEGTTCRMPTRQAGECNRPEDCTGGQACVGVFLCGGGADAGVDDAGVVASRRCFLCGTSSGTGVVGAPCTDGGMCSTGVCFANRCSLACSVGDEGDASCRARGASLRCTNAFFQPAAMGPVSTLGFCAPACAREADCPSDTACSPQLNFFTDRMDFFCIATTRTPRIGDACNPAMSACRNGLCIPTSATTGYCTAPCIDAADCPASAPLCDPITFNRPSGMGQPGRACRPRP